jgi:hypothetical protein
VAPAVPNEPPELTYATGSVDERPGERSHQPRVAPLVFIADLAASVVKYWFTSEVLRINAIPAVVEPAREPGVLLEAALFHV